MPPSSRKRNKGQARKAKAAAAAANANNLEQRMMQLSEVLIMVAITANQ